MAFDFKKEYKEFYMPMEMCYSSSMRLQKQFISTFMCVASFGKNCSEGLGKFSNKRHLYYRCTACQFAF